MAKHKLIVIEGLDGSGKATQAKRLAATLTENKIPVKQVTFPDYENPSSALIKLYLNGSLGQNPADVNPYATSSFFAVDRFASYKQFWENDYLNGKLILADRYTTSNEIYQLAKLPKDNWNSFLNWMEEYEYKLLGIPKPDLVLYLDMPVEVSQELMKKRYNGDESKKDLHERNVKFLMQCRKSALYAAGQLSWNIVSCAENEQPRPVEEVAGEIWQKVKSVL